MILAPRCRQRQERGVFSAESAGRKHRPRVVTARAGASSARGLSRKRLARLRREKTSSCNFSRRNDYRSARLKAEESSSPWCAVPRFGSGRTGDMAMSSPITAISGRRSTARSCPAVRGSLNSSASGLRATLMSKQRKARRLIPAQRKWRRRQWSRASDPHPPLGGSRTALWARPLSLCRKGIHQYQDRVFIRRVAAWRMRARSACEWSSCSPSLHYYSVITWSGAFRAKAL